jgi:hypothetical protein
MTKASFEHHVAALQYADANDLELVWEGTAAFEKRRRTLRADQFEVRTVHTRKGITNVGLFLKRGNARRMACGSAPPVGIDREAQGESRALVVGQPIVAGGIE